MKTPTLIVRLVGLYLLATCTVGLRQLHSAESLAPQLGGPQKELMGELQLYFWLGLLLGLAATIFAGPLARLLTFDSEPTGKRPDLSDQLLGR